MDELGGRDHVQRLVDRWLVEEDTVPAPDRLLAEVFERTGAMRQHRSLWANVGRSAVARRVGAIGAPVPVLILVGLTLLLVAGMMVGGAGRHNAIEPVPGATVSSVSSAHPRASDPQGQDRGPALVILRTHPVCAAGGTLIELPATASTRASAWVTCAADSVEVVLGTDTVTPRPGLGVIAVDGATEWAIRGDSVVELDPDRSIGRAVRIGTPSAIAVGSGKVWVLDARTGVLSAIGPVGVERTVVPGLGGRPSRIAIAAGSLWVLDPGLGAVLRRDIQDGHQTGLIPVSATAAWLGTGGDAVYVADSTTDTIVRIDPATNVPTSARPDLGSDGNIDALDVSADGLLIGSRSSVFRLDPVTLEVVSGASAPGYVVGVGQSADAILVLTEGGSLVEALIP